MLFIIFLVIAITTLMVYLHQTYTRLSRAGVRHLPPVPIFGNLLRGVLRKEHMLDSISKPIQTFPEDRIVGRYELLTPVFIINDPDLLRQVTISDFDYFTDRRPFTDESDPMFGRNILCLEGELWRAMRSNLSPLFTSSKIRMMVPFIVEVSERMVQALKTRIQQSENGYTDLEAKELTGRYAVDVLASCAFGLRVESHSEDNEFYSHTKAMTNFNFLRFLKTCAFRSFPSIARLLNISLAPPGTAKFFEDVVMSTIQHREEHNIVRPDMIHLLMLAKKGLIPFEVKDKAGDEGFASVEEAGQRKYHVDWTYKDLISQAVLFVFAGFDTVSSSMAFMFYQLAINPEVQERLYQEISENEDKCGRKFEYTNISKLNYVDMFVSECLRCWPPGGFMDRLCVKDYNLGKPRPDAKNDCIIRKGECIGLPYWAFHYNPKFFPDPEKFDPERFSEENKDKIKPYTYLPFGAGFRNCIGSRLALHEVKIFLYQMVLNFKFSAFEKTPPRAQLVSQGYDMEIKNGAWVRLQLRTT